MSNPSFLAAVPAIIKFLPPSLANSAKNSAFAAISFITNDGATPCASIIAAFALIWLSNTSLLALDIDSIIESVFVNSSPVCPLEAAVLAKFKLRFAAS